MLQKKYHYFPLTANNLMFVGVPAALLFLGFLSFKKTTAGLKKTPKLMGVEF